MSAPLPRIPGPSVTDLPPGVSLEQVLADLADDQVAAPADRAAELVEQVERARDLGVDLSIVVVERDPRIDSQLRDLATEIGSEDGGTVLVLSPGWVGTYSDNLDRVTLEAAQDRTYTGDPVVSARNFVDSLAEPSQPWTLWTILLIVVVAAAAGVTYLVKSRRRRGTEVATPEPVPGPGDRSSTA
ncbi:Rv1476 family membrane protein [Rhodococcus chondri]|uniref:TPM domain-containing protein n=1 Tax=Rhodococcus chondri TaxID=3065941 RepID=A0ABU7JSB9_9NOCA|nr:DUF6676 family protein [Rhodococcus sp. CC-R104]MEE2032931.1 hypothetical protein [Rhodococcus sp. CC-R104]